MRIPRAWLTMVIVGTLALIGGGILVFGRRGRPTPPPSPAVNAAPAPSVAPVIRRWLDGQPLVAGAGQPFAIAVIVDNAPEARPQSGIADAPLVFEVPVEGGRTRFLAVFPDDADVPEVGPVRSARPYLVGLARMLPAVFVHVGGSPDALAMLQRDRLAVASINQYYDPPFRRVRFRPAPFNVYASVPELAAFARAHDRSRAPQRPDDEPPFLPFDAEHPLSETAVDASVVRMPYHDAVRWEYDVGAKQYTRWQGGTVQRDADGTPIIVDNVVLLRVRSRVLDAIGRLALVFPASDTPPAGRAMAASIFRDGKRADGTWMFRISEVTGSFAITASDGTALTLRPGRTWITFVDSQW